MAAVLSAYLPGSGGVGRGFGAGGGGRVVARGSLAAGRALSSPSRRRANAVKYNQS